MIRKFVFSLLFLVGLIGFSPAAETSAADSGTSVTIGSVAYKVSDLATTQVIVPKAEVVIPDPLPPAFLDIVTTSDSVTVTVVGNVEDQVEPALIAVILIEGGEVSQRPQDVVSEAISLNTIQAPKSAVRFDVTPSTEEARTFTLVAVSLQQVQ